MIDDVTPEIVSRTLRCEFGIEVADEEVVSEWRHWRWVAHLPDDRIVFIAGPENSARRLARERAVLEILSKRVPFQVPLIERATAEDDIQIRRKIPGVQVGGDGREARFADTVTGPRLAIELGQALAALHRAISVREAEKIGLPYQSGLPTADYLENRLSGSQLTRNTTAALADVLDRYRGLVVPDDDLAVIHGDAHGGNLAVDPATGALVGLFDFDDIAIGDRYFDLRYIYSFGSAFLERAFAAYEETSGRAIPESRVRLYHILSALDALASSLERTDDPLRDERRGWVDWCVDTLI